jgi:hypothetical protein
MDQKGNVMSRTADYPTRIFELQNSLRDALLLVETLMLATKDPNTKAQCARCLELGMKRLEG